MKTILVNYHLPQKPAKNEMIGQFTMAANAKFLGMPGLQSKQFCYDESTGDGLSVYLWETAEQAEAFARNFPASFRETFGVEPDITLHETLVLVDNRANDVLSAT